MKWTSRSVERGGVNHCDASFTRSHHCRFRKADIVADSLETHENKGEQKAGRNVGADRTMPILPNSVN